ncbi:NADPH-dependent 2,4-dienoyl-CoA reductase/sulfur reductase-like enzyme [Brevibacterium sanguinis]|uniref:NADPH-dependent 2,4-dienoyl-CoA reductase/sulfur reductase-like enzyme n=2 Tax=Brevibacterium TaxID=1696 RepID=A0A366IGT0_9MICO|nr:MULTISPECIES: FAD-dependent oxidoreductase [Brevibacterium]RBP62924.1 NADPH-dependent 2,4-dienoyl-CoA reductase/sulfur reductase-like enzyme [Brevibacterium sanguinis]RBP69531.1 NADPH-dependent 2,4-dienoyl-CoA reductase/sulfur reductase-like enzyme [Brevibacterium celere]
MGRRIVIIGAGLAGTTAAREFGDRGQAVTLIDPRAGETYERPPLSKHLFDGGRYHLPYHLGSSDLVTLVRARALQITLAEAAHSSQQTVPSPPGDRSLAEAGHPEVVGTVDLDTGESIAFTHCILATGMEANAPHVPGYPDALPVYNLGEAEWIRAQVDAATDQLDVGVLGSGYLGMEVATSAVAAGHLATVYLRGTEPLRRQLSKPVRDALVARHRDAGVRFVTGLTDPADIPAGVHDLMVTSVGARPELIPINGQMPEFAWDVDEKLATSHPGVWAAGDCARVSAGPYALDHPWACKPVAETHGRYLAQHLMGETDEPWSDVPWHWSFQGPEKVFTAGLTRPDVEGTLTKPHPDGKKMQVFHFAGPEPEALLIGVETLGWPPMQAAARRVLDGNHIPTRAQIEDPDFDLKAHSRL